MTSWRKVAFVVASGISVPLGGLLSAVALGAAAVITLTTLAPLEPEEAAGPQFAYGILVLGVASVGFISGCAATAIAARYLGSRLGFWYR